MNLKSTQSPSSILMIRPHHFKINNETAEDNTFQKKFIQQKNLEQSAYKEISKSAEILSNHGIEIHMFENSLNLHQH